MMTFSLLSFDYLSGLHRILALTVTIVQIHTDRCRCKAITFDTLIFNSPVHEDTFRSDKTFLLQIPHLSFLMSFFLSTTLGVRYLGRLHTIQIQIQLQIHITNRIRGGRFDMMISMSRLGWEDVMDGIFWTGLDGLRCAGWFDICEIFCCSMETPVMGL